jgi:hypothetical protein
MEVAPGQLSTSLNYIDLTLKDYLMPSFATTFTAATYGDNFKWALVSHPASLHTLD